MRPSSPMLLVSLVALSGCSLFHSNIKGGFACAAPSGTCAPSMRIDDDAIRSIAGKDGHDSTTQAVGPSAPRQADNRPAIFIPGARAAIKVVFPVWRDAAGQLHPRTTAYAPVDAPPAANGSVSPVDGGSLGHADSTSLLAIAEMAPEIAPLPASPQAADRTTQSGDAPVPASALLPHPAQGTTQAPGPLDTIKDQVKQILSAVPRPAVRPQPPKPAVGAGKPAATFPPAGN